MTWCQIFTQIYPLVPLGHSKLALTITGNRQISNANIWHIEAETNRRNVLDDILKIGSHLI